MADQGFNKIFVLIAICLYIQLDVVLLTDSDGVTYYYEINTAGDLGVTMQYTKADSLKIAVFYDAQSPSANDFFNKQITPTLLEKAGKCSGLKFIFTPCSNVKDNAPSEANLIDVCVANALPKKGDPTLVRSFIACSSAGTSRDDCFNQIQVDTNTVNECVGSDETTQNCLNANQNFSVVKSGGGEKTKAIEDVKTAICQVLSNDASAWDCFPALCGKT